MARKDRPYLPLYVQDLLTDERLIECSAEAHGVYFRLMCILHKQETYGLLCLKQKHKQNTSKTNNFATLLVKQMPFEQEQIQKCLQELHDEGVIGITDDSLFQKRMVNDGKLSLTRSDIGKTGGSSVTKQYGKPGFLYWIGDNYNKNKIGISINVLNRLYRLRSDLNMKKLKIIDTIEVPDMGVAEDFALSFFNNERDGEWVLLDHSQMANKFALLKANIKAKALPNTLPNSDIDIDISIYRVLQEKNNLNGDSDNEKKEAVMVVVEMMKVWMTYKPGYTVDNEVDYPALLWLAYYIAGEKKWRKSQVTGDKEIDVVKSWVKIVDFIKSPECDQFFKRMTLDGIANKKNIQKIVESMKTGKFAILHKQAEQEKNRITPDQYFTE